MVPAPENPNLLQKIDRAVYRVERALAGGLFLAMVGVMFTYVVHLIYSSQEGKLSAALLAILRKLGSHPDPTTIHGWVSDVMNVGIAFLLAYAGVRTTRREPPFPRLHALAYAAGATAAGAALVKLVLWIFAGGIEWGPAFALACMLWVGFLGASLATYEKRHLALEMGEKIWGTGKLSRIVKALAMVVTAAFCLFLLYLAWRSVKMHYVEWAKHDPPVPGERLSGDTWIPIWAVFAIFPYTFLVMCLRFAGQAVGALGPAPAPAPGEAAR